MINTRDELREVVARALYPKAWGRVPFAGFYGLMPKGTPREKADAYWWERGEPERKKSLLMADHVLGAIKSADLAVVPMEATEGMCKSAAVTRHLKAYEKYCANEGAAVAEQPVDASAMPLMAAYEVYNDMACAGDILKGDGSGKQS